MIAGAGEGAASAPAIFRAPAWHLRDRVLQASERPLIMGVLNLTPDSFYPASRQTATTAAVAAGLKMVASGAEVLDLGAESSRPGRKPVGAAEDCARLLPVLKALRRETTVPLSVDTFRAATARAALDAGADVINDITAAKGDPEMLPLVAQRDCGLILMHMQGRPATMQDEPRYADVAAEITTYLAERVAVAVDQGVAAERIVVDPGVGFGKGLAHNLALLAALESIAGERPLLLGASRKSFIGEVTGAAVDDRLGGSLAALAAAFSGRAALVRVHDVAPSLQFLTTLAAIAGARDPDQPEIFPVEPADR